MSPPRKYTGHDDDIFKELRTAGFNWFETGTAGEEGMIVQLDTTGTYDAVAPLGTGVVLADTGHAGAEFPIGVLHGDKAALSVPGSPANLVKNRVQVDYGGYQYVRVDSASIPANADIVPSATPGLGTDQGGTTIHGDADLEIAHGAGDGSETRTFEAPDGPADVDTFTLTKLVLEPLAALATHATDIATLVVKNGSDTIATYTNDSGGAGVALVEGTPLELTITGTGSELEFAKEGAITVEITEGGSGAAISATLKAEFSGIDESINQRPVATTIAASEEYPASSGKYRALCRLRNPHAIG